MANHHNNKSESSCLQNGTSNQREKQQWVHQALQSELRSIMQKSDEENRCKCMVRFHNCTPYRVTPHWFDFKGLPIPYPIMQRGSSINIDTYASHLWYFKAEHSPNETDKTNQRPLKVLAVPEEAINWPAVDVKAASDRSNFRALVGINGGLMCPLCKFTIKKCLRGPTSIPCPHFTGEAKYSASDIDCRMWSNYNSNYVYSCDESMHLAEHSQNRRNIFLVEPFYNLRERCFLALKSRIRDTDIFDLNLPLTLQKDYLKFSTTSTKLEKKSLLDLKSEILSL